MKGCNKFGPLVKTEFDQLDLTKGEADESAWNSPSRTGYGSRPGVVHGHGSATRSGYWRSVTRYVRRADTRCKPAIRGGVGRDRQGQVALWVGIAGKGAQLLRGWRDGFWLHRWLVGQGIANLVVDAASIEVDRRARRTKTDRTDVINLHRNLLRYHGGERRYGRWRGCPRWSRKTRAGRCARRSGCGTKPPRTATALGHCWCCTGCEAARLGAGAGQGGGRCTLAGYRRRCGRRSNARWSGCDWCARSSRCSKTPNAR